MSAFLGPIHYWLFKKIKFQNDVTKSICEYYDNKGFNLKSEMEEKYGTLEEGQLENLIDGSNIHGWLQERVSLVEYSYAYVIHSLLNSDKNEIDNLKKIMSEIGENNKIPSEILNARDAYKYVEDLFLDGMPCDRANSVISEDNEEIIVKRNICVHESYWNEVGEDIENYYILRNSLINGILHNSKFEFTQINKDTFKIKRGE